MEQVSITLLVTQEGPIQVLTRKKVLTTKYGRTVPYHNGTVEYRKSNEISIDPELSQLYGVVHNKQVTIAIEQLDINALETKLLEKGWQKMKC